MNLHFVVIGAALVGLSLAGCASRASAVAPVSVASTDYAKMNCDAARAELTSARVKESALSKKQNNAATADAASVFLFLLPLGSVFGADVEGELAQAKGETIAIERHIKTSCQ